jgi:hypothetical protein
MRGEKPFCRKKWVFSPHKGYQLFKADSSQSIENNLILMEIKEKL